MSQNLWRQHLTRALNTTIIPSALRGRYHISDFHTLPNGNRCFQSLSSEAFMSTNELVTLAKV